MIRLLGAVVLCAGFLAAQPAADVQGWDPARWGMTEAEVLAAFKGKPKPARKPLVGNGMAFRMSVSDVRFATLEGTLSFGFAEADGRLQAVAFSPEKEYWDEFEILERHLIAAYGPSPRKQNPPGSVPLNTDVTWLLPSSRIDLMQSGSREPGRKVQGLVIMRYMALPAPK